MPGFIITVTRDFKDLAIIKTLHNTYAGSRLEDSLIVWCLGYQVCIDSLEAFQHKFLKFLHF